MNTIKLISIPTVLVIAEPRISAEGVEGLLKWTRDYRPECLPDEEDGPSCNNLMGLLPHADAVTDAEMLAEMAGRGCYLSWGLKAGRKSNKEYLAHTQEGDVPHRSIFYHPKFTFFIAGVSRRVSHELIRNYVGADRTEEGSPSQESTRYTEHPGHYIIPPFIQETKEDMDSFYRSMQDNYDAYRSFLNKHMTPDKKGLARKRVYEAASAYLSHSVATSFFWTTNPIALAKLFQERHHEAADREFYNLAALWKKICIDKWPNLFPQPHMKNV